MVPLPAVPRWPWPAAALARAAHRARTCTTGTWKLGFCQVCVSHRELCRPHYTYTPQLFCSNVSFPTFNKDERILQRTRASHQPVPPLSILLTGLSPTSISLTNASIPGTGEGVAGSPLNASAPAPSSQQCLSV